MVTQHYRWDFVGLSTDTKPTPETSEKVVDGSTFYCSDTSKLYVFCKDTWYERKALGGGGGGTTYTAGDGIDITNDTISVDTTTIQPKLTAGSNVSISDNTISATDTTYSNFTGTDGTATGTAGLVPAPATTDAGKFLKADGTWDTAGGGGGGGIKFLSASDFNYDDGNTGSFNTVAMWLLDDGFYFFPSDHTAVPVKGCLDGTNNDKFNYDVQNGVFFFFIKSSTSFWLFVNPNNQDTSIFANRPLYFCKVNSANGWFTYEANDQLAKRSELTS